VTALGNGSVIATFDDGPYVLGEGPVFDSRTNSLLWVDIKGHSILCRALEEVQTTRISVDEDVGSIALTDDSNVVVAALRTGWYQVHLGTGERHLLAAPPRPRPTVRFNDGAVDTRGRPWTGWLEDGERDPVGRLYRLSADGSFRSVDAGFIASNGIDWSPDGQWMYIVDSRRALLETIYLPVLRPTSLTFGGADLGVMYITSASFGLSQADRTDWPVSGAVLARTARCPGRPANTFVAGTRAALS
jgi:sugar lactone lactonase YvrE